MMQALELLRLAKSMSPDKATLNSEEIKPASLANIELRLPVNESVSPSVGRSVSQSVSPSVSQSVSQSISQSVGQSVEISF